MTAINENGQVFFTFEELDLDGAMKEVKAEIKYLCGEILFYQQHVVLAPGMAEEEEWFNSCLIRRGLLQEVAGLIRRYM